MSATVNQGALEQRDNLLRTLGQATDRVKKGDNTRFDGELGMAAQAYKDGIPFKVTWLTPETLGKFLSLETREPNMFNQMASEVPFCVLLDRLLLAAGNSRHCPAVHQRAVSRRGFH